MPKNCVLFSSTLIALILLALNNKFTAAQTIDCQRPPQLVDPATCCQDGGRDQNAEKCALQAGANGSPPTMETATCLAECILNEAQLLLEPQKLNLEKIRSELTNKFSNDTAYVDAMATAFAKCEPQAQQRLAAFQRFNLENTASQLSELSQAKKQCSPFSAMVLGCTYMEYFKNCPKHRWTESAECALAKNFVIQCGLGA